MSESKSNYTKQSTLPSQSETVGSSEEWAGVQDRVLRRKIQNKLAQRRFRDKAKEQRAETQRESQNQEKISSSYVPPEPGEIEEQHEPTGLPWGGISFSHIVEAGKTKQKSSERSSRESSAYAAKSRAGGSSK